VDYFGPAEDALLIEARLRARLPPDVGLAIAKIRSGTDARRVLAEHASRFPDEAELVARAVPKRIFECLAARELARRLLAEQNGPPRATILHGTRREPLWPEGFVGSIAHSDGLVVVALARGEHYAALGIDLEPNQPLPQDILNHVALPGETSGAPAPRAIFVVKETFYKAHNHLHGRFLDFPDVRVHFSGDEWNATELDAPMDAIGPTTFGGFTATTSEWVAAFCAVVR
jgi:4'-phosphopantetheinyl transferase EntD